MDKYGEFIVDKVFKNKKGETSYTGKFKKSGEKREFILHSKDKVVRESVNEAGLPGEAVGFIEKDNGRRKLIKVFNTYRGGLMWQKRTGMKLLNQSGIHLVGVMSKEHWDKHEAPYAENLKKADMKVVSKREWDKTHKDFKGMIKGQPYMMWLDKKTKATVYGPVTIKEEVVSEGLSPDIAKHMVGIHKGFVKVERDGTMIYDSPTTAKKAADYLNSKKVAASSDGKYLYIESINEGRGFVAAARKAKEEGKTEFEFNGKTYPVTLKEGMINEMSDAEFVADQLVNPVADGTMDRREFITFVSKETNVDKNTLGKVYDAYFKLGGRDRVKLDKTSNALKFLSKFGIK